ncbi:hypothetical protein C454_11156 [Haloferax gibbonsii ATCC 33959]|uniref:Transcriptional regulator n=1 Tax=Haloferax gibbonsii (strain ATCC 33959 / DSM 4427 / JCM 8863 / NBRC 102184 / NCIMB 2188 / Ma 2.38) TaxID=1227459 RepID=M0H6Q1_HALGM|nr:hypothetical protein [Haloferax gibbonsii]ELZ80165.1 hypothetical protein C454_11156 [Haloferax gibbonsii ATCC 33959]
MTDELPLRDKDLTVLQCISEGKDDIQKITSATTLENHEVNYCFTKLEKHGLLKIRRTDGYTTRIVNGQKRTFKAPKRAELTKSGKQHLEKRQESEIHWFEYISQEEIIQLVRRQEQRIERLETAVEMLRERFQKNI